MKAKLTTINQIRNIISTQNIVERDEEKTQILKFLDNRK